MFDVNKECVAEKLRTPFPRQWRTEVALGSDVEDGA
jgi:hypothetical protein